MSVELVLQKGPRIPRLAWLMLCLVCTGAIASLVARRVEYKEHGSDTSIGKEDTPSLLVRSADLKEGDGHVHVDPGEENTQKRSQRISRVSFRQSDRSLVVLERLSKDGLNSWGRLSPKPELRISDQVDDWLKVFTERKTHTLDPEDDRFVLQVLSKSDLHGQLIVKLTTDTHSNDFSFTRFEGDDQWYEKQGDHWMRVNTLDMARILNIP